MANIAPIEAARGLIASLEGEFVKSLSDQSLTFARESGFALQALQNNPYLLDIARGNQASLKAAIINVAAIGISLNPAAKLAYLVPRDKRVCLDVSYIGLMHIAQQSGAILWCQSAVVRRNDHFRRQGIDRAPEHSYDEFATEEVRGDIVGVYCVIKTADGDYLTHTMPIANALAIRDRSSAWKAWVNKKKSCPWVTDEEQMILKTCVKQAAKYWPRRDRLDSAIEYLNTEAGEGIDFEAEQKQQVVDVTPISDNSLKRIARLLKDTGKTEANILTASQRLIGRAINAITDMTDVEALRVIAFMQARARKMQQPVAEGAV